jgi:hypothetical protein
MEDILNRVIIEQNKDLLKKIANDNFFNETDKQNFIDKYSKLNYTLLLVVKKNIMPEYEKRLDNLIK